MSERQVEVRVTGRVQGVWFRSWTEGEARRLGLAGWVRNRDDGAVEAAIGGPAQDVAALLDKLWKGPPAARVDDVVVRDTDGADLPRPFETRR